MPEAKDPNPLPALLKLATTAELPDLAPSPRSNAKPLRELNQQLDLILANSALPKSAREIIRGAVLLWHDHLDAAHAIAQDVPTADGSLLHGIMHRREPDYGNAKYWFRRVGKHPCFPQIARRAADWLEQHRPDQLKARLLPKGQWDPMAFIDACEEAAGLPATDARVQVLQELQKIEFEVLLEFSCGSR